MIEARSHQASPASSRSEVDGDSTSDQKLRKPNRFDRARHASIVNGKEKSSGAHPCASLDQVRGQINGTLRNVQAIRLMTRRTPGAVNDHTSRRTECCDSDCRLCHRATGRPNSTPRTSDASTSLRKNRSACPSNARVSSANSSSSVDIVHHRLGSCYRSPAPSSHP